MHLSLPKNRFDALADGIFAVVMTLLVLEIHLPEAEQMRTDAQVWAALGHVLPSFVPYAMSFFVLGLKWRSALAQRTDSESVSRRYASWFMLYMFLVTCVPFSTLLVTRAGQSAVSVWMYCLNTALLAGAAWQMDRQAQQGMRHAAEGFNAQEAVAAEQKQVRRSNLIASLSGAAVASVWACFDPRWALLAFALNGIGPRLRKVRLIRGA